MRAARSGVHVARPARPRPAARAIARRRACAWRARSHPIRTHRRSRAHRPPPHRYLAVRVRVRDVRRAEPVPGHVHGGGAHRHRALARCGHARADGAGRWLCGCAARRERDVCARQLARAARDYGARRRQRRARRASDDRVARGVRRRPRVGDPLRHRRAARLHARRVHAHGSAARRDRRGVHGHAHLHRVRRRCVRGHGRTRAQRCAFSRARAGRRWRQPRLGARR
mmetsp:Transcript_13928/g.36119  ORF Transcript_13928/g.36119 Transcript_13928/m.36119 type:complete len:227 (-) Transcript_13928:519-1199(-)